MFYNTLTPREVCLPPLPPPCVLWPFFSGVGSLGLPPPPPPCFPTPVLIDPPVENLGFPRTGFFERSSPSEPCPPKMLENTPFFFCPTPALIVHPLFFSHKGISCPLFLNLSLSGVPPPIPLCPESVGYPLLSLLTFFDALRPNPARSSSIK